MALGLLIRAGSSFLLRCLGLRAELRSRLLSPRVRCFGEALERFAREQFLSRGTGRELESSRKKPFCFRALAPESEQLERVRDERTRVDRKKAVSA